MPIYSTADCSWFLMRYNNGFFYNNINAIVKSKVNSWMIFSKKCDRLHFTGGRKWYILVVQHSRIDLSYTVS